MQWLNSLDSAIDRLTTPRRAAQEAAAREHRRDEDDDITNQLYDGQQEGEEYGGSRILNDAEAAAAENDGFSSDGDLMGIFNNTRASGGYADASLAAAGARHVINIGDDAAAAISPLQHEDGEEDAFVNGTARTHMIAADAAAGRRIIPPLPTLPLHPHADPRLVEARSGISDDVSAISAMSATLQTRSLRPPLGPVAGSRATPSAAGGGAAASAAASASASPFPGRLIKRARPPTPPSLSENESIDEEVISKHLRSYIGGIVTEEDDVGSTSVLSTTDQPQQQQQQQQQPEPMYGYSTPISSRQGAVRLKDEAVEEADADQLRLKQQVKRIAQEEEARIEREAEAERVRIAEEQRQARAREEAEQVRIAKEQKAREEAERRTREEEQARIEEAKRIADKEAEAERRRIAEEQARIEEEQRRAAESEARRIAVAKAKAEQKAREEAETQLLRIAAQERDRIEEARRIAAEEAKSVQAAKIKAEAEQSADESVERKTTEEEKSQSAGESDVQTVDDYQDDTALDDDEHDIDSEYNDYEVHLPLQPWDVPSLSCGKDGHDDGTLELTSLASPLPQWDPAMNRRGVVQIRLHRAQRLPCPVGKSVRASISLPPWRGKVTTKFVVSYAGPEGVDLNETGEEDTSSFVDVGAGVCVRWDDSDGAGDDVKGGDDMNDDDTRSKSSTTSHSTVMTYNMMHQYNDVNTPVPDIAIELTSSSMLGFEKTLSVVVPLSVGVLMREPGIWRRRWCPALPPEKGGAPQPSTPRRVVSGGIGGDGASAQASARRKFSTDAFNDYGTAETLGPLLLLEARFVSASLGRSDDYDEDDKEELENETISTTVRGESPSTEDTSLQPLVVSAPGANRVPLDSVKSVATISSFVDASAHEMPRDTPLSITRVEAPSESEGPTLDAFMKSETELEPDLDSQSVTSALTASTAAKSQRRLLRAKPHHMRVLPSWSSPTWCSVCSTFMVPFRVTSYQCESCNIYCCINCQLRVDVRLPCGSDEAKKAAEAAKRSTFAGAFSGVMSVVAPVEERAEGEDEAGSTIEVNGETAEKVGSALVEGIGSLRIKIVRACLYDRPYPPETDLRYILKKKGRALRVGDHYARITWTDSGALSRRTRTVFQTAMPHFDSEVMEFNIPHYGTEYRIELVDANTDKVVGTWNFPVQSALQWQRDEISTSSTLPLSSILDIRKQGSMRKKTIVELRTGVKSGFGLDYFNAGKKNDAHKGDTSESGRSGEISGWIECDMDIAEDTKGLICGPNTRPIAARSPDDFRVELVQLHIARIGVLVADLKRLCSAYSYLVSWNDPVLTALSLVVFVWFCLRFNMEYIGSLPISIVALYMTYLWKKRRAGQFSSRWIKTEREARVKAEKKMTINYSTHRPIGFLDVAVVRGRNLRSYELGLPGAAYASVSWDALRFASEADRKKLSEHDPTAKAIHELGSTVAAGITSNPEWKSIVESSESERLKQLLPADENGADADGETQQDTAAGDSEHPSLQFPILQPVAYETKPSGNHERSDGNSVHLIPWTSSPGAIVVQICFQDALNKFALIDPYFGDVIIPLHHLAEEKEIEGWFRISDLGILQPSASADNLQSSSMLVDSSGSVSGEPEVYLKMKLAIPESSEFPADMSDAEKEASIIIAEEMMRMGAMAGGENIGLIGTSLGTINTVRGLGGQLQGIQNILGNFLDTVERIHNLFNFSSPNKSAIVVVFLLALWLVLATIPTRVLLLVGGIAQYAATFYAAFGNFKKKKRTSGEPTEEEESEGKTDSTATRIRNFFAALPTDEDLRRAYFWDARREGEKAREELALKKRMMRLKRLWRAQWFGTVELKEATSSKQADRLWDWEPVFALVHGHRFIWWRSEKHFDDGEPPLGQIFFAGHSGLGGLSPIEMRELSREEALLIVTMFGRGLDGQQKISLLCPDKASKEGLEDAVIAASTGSKMD